jgi:pimeloyl-ACP methyl ester carboxylesterase
MKKFKALFPLFLLFSISVVHSQSTVQTGYYSSFDGTKIYYETIGEGQPVVLVHGFTGTNESWKRSPLYSDLIRDGFKVVTMDLRGNGKSDKPHIPEAYEDDAEARDIMGLTSMLALGKYKVIGYSRGSIITARLMVLDKNVERGVLGGMGADFTNPKWERPILFYKALMGEDVPELKGMVQWVKDNGLDQLALACSQKGQPVTSPKELKKISFPVLVISGTDDEDNGSVKELSELIPHSTYERVPGNHNNTTQSADFSAAVLSFLKK